MPASNFDSPPAQGPAILVDGLYAGGIGINPAAFADLAVTKGATHRLGDFTICYTSQDSDVLGQYMAGEQTAYVYVPACQREVSDGAVHIGEGGPQGLVDLLNEVTTHEFGHHLNRRGDKTTAGTVAAVGAVGLIELGVGLGVAIAPDMQSARPSCAAIALGITGMGTAWAAFRRFCGAPERRPKEKFAYAFAAEHARRVRIVTRADI